MEMFYQTNGIHCFIDVCLGDVDDVMHNQKTYMLHMIENNKIPYIISPVSGEIDGRVWLKYSVDNKINLRQLFKQTKPDSNFLKILMDQINKCINNIEKYLLTPDDLVLDPEYMLYDIRQNTLMLIYAPDYNHELKSQIRSLFEYVMVNFEHRDKTGIDVMYEIYDLVVDGNFEMWDLEQVLNKNREFKAVKNEETPVFEEKTIANKNTGKMLIMLCELFFAIAFFAVGVFFGGGLKFIAASIVALIVLICNIIFASENRYEDMDDAMKQYDNAMKEYEGEKKQYDNAEKEHEDNIHKMVPMTNDTLKEINLDGLWDNIVVGRGRKSADYVLTSNRISRVHACITKKNNQIYIEDRESANGTYVNSVRLNSKQAQIIKTGDIVAFANEEFFVR